MGYSENVSKASCFSVDSSSVHSCVAEDRKTPSAMGRKAGTTPLEKMVEIQSEAEFLLRSAVMNERARRWDRVVNMYKDLLKRISRPNMPPGFTVTDSYVMLVYESYYHLGLALQNLGQHKEAIVAYTQAIKSVNIHKNGCLAGCSSNSCFQTPVLAKRAFAHARAGDMKKAFVDIEKAVVLDTRNSDLFCIRALLWNTVKDTEKAVDDLNRALRYNPCHVCALLLRGSIDEPFRITFNFLEGLSLKNNEKAMKKDHLKAQQINPQAVQYMDVVDIHSPKLIKLWNRFLWSLNVPRNIVHPELMEGFNVGRSDMDLGSRKQTKERIAPQATMPAIQINGVNASSDTSENSPAATSRRSLRRPFRCGTPTMQRDSVYDKRRRSYGKAIRTYSAALKDTSTKSTPLFHPARPATAGSTNSLRTQTPSPLPEPQIPRPPSEAKKRPSVTFSHPLLTVPDRRPGTVSAPPTLAHPHSRRSSFTPPTLNVHRPSIQTVVPLITVPMTTITSSSLRSKRDETRFKKRSASEYAHKVHGMRVFEPLNVTDAPRMYYKPWSGDKLPVADVRTRATVGVFRV